MKDVVEYVGRNPLAIKVFGSHLRSMRNLCIDNWKMELDKLKEIPHYDILEKLKISYDALGETEQKIFLDIACFFKGMKREFVESILNKCDFHGTTGRDGFGFFANIGMDALIDKSLITLDGNTNSLDMHDLMQQMGWEIVRRESEEPGNRSRLWNSKHAYHVFENDTELVNLKSIDLTDSEFLLHLPDLSLAPNLEVIILKNCSRLLEVPWDVFGKIDGLSYLDLSYCNILGFHESIDARALKTLSLEGCPNLTTLPWIASTSLVSLYLDWTPIADLPSWIGHINTISELRLNYCTKLVSLPRSISQLHLLKTLDLEDCNSLDEFPELPTKIVFLYMRASTVKEVPSSSIEGRSRLRQIWLIDFTRLESLPESIFDLASLVDLSLSSCCALMKLPEITKTNTTLERLDLSGSGITCLPSSIGNLTNLKKLYLSYCENLESVGNLCGFQLTHLLLMDCVKIRRVSELPYTLEYLDARGCTSLEEVVQVSCGQGLYERTRNRFWHHSRKVTISTFDNTRFDECLRLNQRSQDNIITAFQLKILHMASHYYATAKCEVKQPPAVTAVLPGSNIPYCFEFQCEDSGTESISVTVPLPEDWRGEGIMGFALCTVYQDEGWDTNVYCKIEFKVKDKAFPETTAVFSAFKAYECQNREPLSFQGNVVMWYKHFDYSHLHGRVLEASFRFWLEDVGDMDRIHGVDSDRMRPPTKCGVHILRAKDLKDMDLIHGADSDRKRPREEELATF